MNPSPSPSLTAFVGGGNMARCLVGGLVAAGHDPARILVSEPQAALADALVRDFRIGLADDNADLARRADRIVLAVKPQVAREVCEGLAPALAGRRPLVVSIIAGVRLDQLAGWLGTPLPIVRAMPNTPALIGAGITGLCAGPLVDADARASVERLLASTGPTLWFDPESRMDAVTAVSGGGPAYLFLLIEALESAAIAEGLEPRAARELVVQTCLGAARMARESAEAPSLLRERVTSPGGITAAAIEVLEDGGLRALFARAVARAAERGRELSDQYG